MALGTVLDIVAVNGDEMTCRLGEQSAVGWVAYRVAADD
jgi:hypothetical protein